MVDIEWESGFLRMMRGDDGNGESGRVGDWEIGSFLRQGKTWEKKSASYLIITYYLLLITYYLIKDGENGRMGGMGGMEDWEWGNT